METAWIGLGAMGRPMAAHLSRHGPTRVWNRTAAVAERHAAEHGTRAVDRLEAVAEADVVFSCLPTTREVADVAGRLRDSLRPDTLWVDCTSGEPAASRHLAEELADRGVSYLDAPVSGGTDGAAAGTLTVMVGGAEADVGRVLPLLDAFAARVVHVGPVGAGHAVKAVNNTMLAANLWAAAEGLLALVRQGVPAATALEVINDSSGRSNATENLLGQRVATREFTNTFALGLLAKDVAIAQDVVTDSGTPAPVLRLVGELLRVARDSVGADEDHTAAVRLLEDWCGTQIR